MTKENPQCKWCGSTPIRDVLDGEALCQSCCNKWVRGEQPDPDEQLVGMPGTEPQTYEDFSRACDRQDNRP